MTHNKKVIPFSSGGWSFLDFVYTTDVNPIQQWYEVLSEEARGLFDSLLKNNQKVELPINWVGFKRFLKGTKKGYKIWELQFSADNKQHRILGMFADVRKQAVMLIGCYHKGVNYTPTDALDTAWRRARDVKEGRAKFHERQIRRDL